MGIVAIRTATLSEGNRAEEASWVAVISLRIIDLVLVPLPAICRCAFLDVGVGDKSAIDAGVLSAVQGVSILGAQPERKYRRQTSSSRNRSKQLGSSLEHLGGREDQPRH